MVERAIARNGTFQPPRIKVCGVRAFADLPSPWPLALDAIGVVAWPGSKRAIDASAAALIIAALPHGVNAIVVMVDLSMRDAHAWLERSGAHAVQLCGHESPRDWADFSHPILRRIGVDENAEREIEAWSAIALGFVLDRPESPGGTGLAVDAARAREIASRAPCLLAGGLNGDNVAASIAAVRPRGVDASSRLESELARKDPALVARFVENADRALRAIAAEERAR